MSKQQYPTIVIDTREQLPHAFAHCQTETRKLDAGDYSVAGMESVVAIERKTLGDFLGTVTHDRDRFMRELARMKGYRWKWIVVEAGWHDIVNGNYRSAANPNSMIGTTAALCIRHCPVFFAYSRECANAIIERLLIMAWREWEKEQAMPAAGKGEQHG